jgi:hypothetical protein
LCDKNKDGKLGVDEMKACFETIASTGRPLEQAAAEPTAAQKEELLGKSVLARLMEYDSRGVFEQISTAMRKNKIASFVVILIFLVPLHFAGALPRLNGVVDSVESSVSKVEPDDFAPPPPPPPPTPIP